ncbi:MAG: GntR family transcriptional regulator [Eubacteriales bacterium]|nr:GntR family transcriptional regulator [Eubacteriales bacterium]
METVAGDKRELKEVEGASLERICRSYHDLQATNTQGPLYRTLYLAIRSLIEQGELAPGSKLPTLAKLSGALSLSKGTITHTYNLLQNEGLVCLTQGRGSFVAAAPTSEPNGPGSRKDQAMEAIDDLLCQLSELNFSRQEIQIFLDLKLREFYEEGGGLNIALISSCLEEQNLLLNEVSPLVQADFYNFSFDYVLSGQVSLGDFDLIICSEEIYYSLRMRADLGDESRILPLCFCPDAVSILSLAGLAENTRAGILSFSKSFSERMRKDFYTYSQAGHLESLELLVDDKLDDFLADCDVLIFSTANREYLNRRQMASIDDFVKRGGELLNYRLQGERSSLLGIRMSLEDLADSGKDKV